MCLCARAGLCVALRWAWASAQKPRGCMARASHTFRVAFARPRVCVCVQANNCEYIHMMRICSVSFALLGRRGVQTARIKFTVWFGHLGSWCDVQAKEMEVSRSYEQIVAQSQQIHRLNEQTMPAEVDDTTTKEKANSNRNRMTRTHTRTQPHILAHTSSRSRRKQLFPIHRYSWMDDGKRRLWCAEEEMLEQQLQWQSNHIKRRSSGALGRSATESQSWAVQEWKPKQNPNNRRSLLKTKVGGGTPANNVKYAIRR